MNASLEQALKEAYASAPSNQVIYDTLEFVQPGIQSSQAIVNQYGSVGFVTVDENGNPIYADGPPLGFQANDENGVLKIYQPVAFKFSLPPQTGEGAPTLNIIMDNVNYQVLNFINTAKATKVPVQAIYRPYVVTQLYTQIVNPTPLSPAMNPPLKLFLTNLTIKLTQVQGQAVFMDLVNRKFPLELYTLTKFPTLQLA